MINLTAKYLKQTNHTSKLKDFENAFYSHPNYPSLLATTDSLTQLNIENIAAKVPFAHLNQLPDSFITFLKIEKEDYYLVKKNGTNFSIENEKEVNRNLSTEELEKYWTGVILVIEENDEKEINYTVEKSNYIVFSLLMIVALSSIYFNNLASTQVIFLIITGIGIFVSLEILKTYFNENKQSESKFCSINQNFSCNSIINSKNYAFSKYVEFVDLPIVFFSTAFFSQILGFNSFNIFGFASLVSFPFILYSVYLQKFVLKNWCLLCLFAAFLIIGLGVLFLLKNENLIFGNENLFSVLMLSIFLGAGWFFIKKQLLAAKSNLYQLNNLLRFKRKEEVFTKTSKPIENKEQFKSLEKIVIGHKNAKNTITLFLSPSCPHCHTAYKNAIELYKKHKRELKIELCFNLNSKNTDNPYLIVYKTILFLYNTQHKDYQIALEDWHIKKLSLGEWKSKWFNEQDFNRENNQIEKHYQWCLDADLNHTPIKIFNGLFLPDIYEINELFYFFKE
jgi:uncharacterized membrane protein